MEQTHQFRAVAWWTSGRTGITKSNSAPNAIHFTAPIAFGGMEGGGRLRKTFFWGGGQLFHNYVPRFGRAFRLRIHRSADRGRRNRYPHGIGIRLQARSRFVPV